MLISDCSQRLGVTDGWEEGVGNVWIPFCHANFMRLRIAPALVNTTVYINRIPVLWRTADNEGPSKRLY